ncbi:MAG: UDP-phosphate galactose phosphotransferase [Micrococcales bacterium]|nr:MAG: UDP-phosphate galactose phosphotransferase [Micrococcales bacterium]
MPTPDGETHMTIDLRQETTRAQHRHLPDTAVPERLGHKRRGYAGKHAANRQVDEHGAHAPQTPHSTAVASSLDLHGHGPSPQLTAHSVAAHVDTTDLPPVAPANWTEPTHIEDADAEALLDLYFDAEQHDFYFGSEELGRALDVTDLVPDSEFAPFLEEWTPPAEPAAPGADPGKTEPADHDDAWEKPTRPPAPLSPALRRSWSVFRGVRPLTFASDVVACVLAAVGTSASGLFAVTFTGALVVLFSTRRLYRSRLNLSVLDDLPAILGQWIIATTLTVVATSLAVDTQRWLADEPHPETYFPLVALALIVLGRSIAYMVIRRARAARRVSHRTLIVGAGQVGQQLAATFADHPEYGLNPFCFLDPKPSNSEETQLPILGKPRELARILQENSIHIVVVAFSGIREEEMVRIIRTCDRLETELFVVPRLFELHHVEGDMDTVWGVPLIRLRRSTYRSWTWPVKRVIDVVASAAALLVLGIPMAVLALLVRLDTGPGVIFRQERVGVDGKPLTVLKFRSLRPADEQESDTNWSIEQDPRLSTLGRFLRRSSLDELPQLFNILRGDMSVVGPRPERPHFVSVFQGRYRSYNARHRVPCGLTGMAQVHGLRGNTSIEERARWDNYYIQNWSLWLDTKIILRTLGQVFARSGG